MPVISHDKPLADERVTERRGEGRENGRIETGERRARDRPPGRHSSSKIMDRAITWYLRGPMNRVLYGVTALFIAIFVLMAQTVMAQRQARQDVLLQDESVLLLNTLMETMLDAETGQRGYVLTGNSAYLDPFMQAKTRLEPEVAALHRMALRSGDDEQEHIAHAEQLIRAKVDELDRTVDLVRAGMTTSAEAVVRSNSGERYMAALRQELTWLRDRQAVERQAAFDRVHALEDRLLPLVGVLGIGMFLLVVVALRGERHRAWAEAEAQQFMALRAANEETQLLARELNHRVKNLFSVVLAIITISSRKAAPTSDVLDDIRARVHALSLAHSSSQGLGMAESCKLADVIANIMRPYAEGHEDRVRTSGPEVVLAPRMITPMGLLLHELATNASKYGALSVATGSVSIDWQVVSDEEGSRNLVFAWIESGGPALNAEAGSEPRRTGFGSRLTAMAAQQLGGAIERSWPVTGARINLICPLP
jgi:two-component sensor histidine kinase